MPGYRQQQIEGIKNEVKKLKAKLQPAKYLKFSHGFWCGDYSQADGGFCCFMHWRGLPVGGDGKRHPIYAFQEPIINELENGLKFLAIFKPPKMGITELLLSYAIYKSITDPQWHNGLVGILVGTNFEEGHIMIERCKRMLEGKFAITESYNNKRRFTVNSVDFVAHPAGNYNAIRAKANMRMVIGDEIAFFIRRKEDQTAIQSAFEHYAAGNYTIVALVTTAGEAAAGFAYSIFKAEKSLYKRFRLTVAQALEVHPQSGTSIYSRQAIDKIKSDSPASYRQNFEIQWGQTGGNLFHEKTIDDCIKSYDLDGHVGLGKCREGIDPTFGSGEGSAWAFVITAIVDGKVRPYFATQYKGMQQAEAESKQQELNRIFKPQPIRIDASNPGFVKAIKLQMGERIEYEDLTDDERDELKVIPISFAKHSKAMLTNLQKLVTNDLVEIHPIFEDLISQMRIAKVDERGMLDKKVVQLDLLDGFRLSCYGYNKDRKK